MDLGSYLLAGLVHFEGRAFQPTRGAWALFSKMFPVLRRMDLGSCLLAGLEHVQAARPALAQGLELLGKILSRAAGFAACFRSV